MIWGTNDKKCFKQCLIPDIDVSKMIDIENKKYKTVTMLMTMIQDTIFDTRRNSKIKQTLEITCGFKESFVHDAKNVQSKKLLICLQKIFSKP